MLKTGAVSESGWQNTFVCIKNVKKKTQLQWESVLKGLSLGNFVGCILSVHIYHCFLEITTSLGTDLLWFLDFDPHSCISDVSTSVIHSNSFILHQNEIYIPGTYPLFGRIFYNKGQFWTLREVACTIVISEFCKSLAI